MNHAHALNLQIHSATRSRQIYKFRIYRGQTQCSAYWSNLLVLKSTNHDRAIRTVTGREGMLEIEPEVNEIESAGLTMTAQFARLQVVKECWESDLRSMKAKHPNYHVIYSSPKSKHTVLGTEQWPECCLWTQPQASHWK